MVSTSGCTAKPCSKRRDDRRRGPLSQTARGAGPIQNPADDPPPGSSFSDVFLTFRIRRGHPLTQWWSLFSIGASAAADLHPAYTKPRFHFALRNAIKAFSAKRLIPINVPQKGAGAVKCVAYRIRSSNPGWAAA